jgi:hypothetical protein
MKNKNIIKNQTLLWREKHPENVKKWDKTYYLKNREERLERNKDWYQEHKEITIERAKKWAKNNPEKMKAMNIRYQSNNPDKVNKRAKKWRKDNPEKSKLVYKKWAEQNPEKVRRNHLNQLHKRRAIYKVTDITTEWLRNLYNDSHICPLCNNEMVEEPRKYLSKNLDHIIPINIGGTHTKDNVRVICARCNNARPRNGSDEIIKVILFLTLFRRILKC